MNAPHSRRTPNRPNPQSIRPFSGSSRLPDPGPDTSHPGLGQSLDTRKAQVLSALETTSSTLLGSTTSVSGLFLLGIPEHSPRKSSFRYDRTHEHHQNNHCTMTIRITCPSPMEAPELILHTVTGPIAASGINKPEVPCFYAAVRDGLLQTSGPGAEGGWLSAEIFGGLPVSEPNRGVPQDAAGALLPRRARLSSHALSSRGRTNRIPAMMHPERARAVPGKDF